MLADYSYDNLGNRTGVAFGNGASQAYTYDPISRLSQLTNSLTDTNDLTATFSYSPASQIASTTRTGDMYAWTGHGNGSTAYTQNGLNQQATVGGAAASWDSKGNLTTEPQSGKTYGYSSENLLTSASGGVTLAYDPAMRLYQTVGAATTRFLYDGVDAIAEYNGSNALQRRFVFDPTTDQPVLWYEGTGTASTNRRYLSEDERGSVISVSGSTGASLGLNTYDEYGKPGAANLGRFQYTGQKWIGEANLYDYKARDYVPQLGVFAQTDPIGQEDNANLYAYVGGDPVNNVDGTGLFKCPPGAIKLGSGVAFTRGEIVINGGICIGWGPEDAGISSKSPGETTTRMNKDKGDRKKQPKYCKRLIYKLGVGSETLGKWAQRGGLGLITISPVVARAFGPTAGGGSLLLGVAFISQGGRYRLGGDLLKWLAGGPAPDAPWSKLIAKYAGIDQLGEALGDVLGTEVVNHVKEGIEPNVCGEQ